jgi:hypothetical protein
MVPWSHHSGITIDFFSQIPQSQKIKSINRHPYEFAPVLEDDQMMLRGHYYVAITGFMLFNSWGLNRR